MQPLLFSFCRRPAWVRASLLVGIFALTACSTSKPSSSNATSSASSTPSADRTTASTQRCWWGLFKCASPDTKKPDAVTTSSASQPEKGSAATRKCWFGLFNCAAEAAPASTKPAQQGAASSAAPASTPMKAPTTPKTEKCWLGLFDCAVSDAPAAPEKSATVARPPIATVTASGETPEKVSTQKTIESVITASATEAKPAPAAPLPQAATPAPTVTSPGPASATLTAPSAPPQKPWLGIFRPYKIDIQQGNFVSQEAASRLREGMTKEQVRFLLGAPLLTDLFHAERWDYVFRLQKGNGLLTSNRLTVFFKDNRVARFVNTPLPNETEYLRYMSGSDAKQAPAPVKEKTQDKPALPATPNHS